MSRSACSSPPEPQEPGLRQLSFSEFVRASTHLFLSLLWNRSSHPVISLSLLLSFFLRAPILNFLGMARLTCSPNLHLFRLFSIPSIFHFSLRFHHMIELFSLNLAITCFIGNKEFASLPASLSISYPSTSLHEFRQLNMAISLLGGRE